MKLDLENGSTYGLNPGLIRQRFSRGMRENYWCVVRNRSRDTTHSTCLFEDPCPTRHLAQRGVILTWIHGRLDMFHQGNEMYWTVSCLLPPFL
jgi:hypothetical protein